MVTSFILFNQNTESHRSNPHSWDSIREWRRQQHARPFRARLLFDESLRGLARC